MINMPKIEMGFKKIVGKKIKKIVSFFCAVKALK